ncbi:hypothetical protein BABINDRAFT_129348 [Babjeviella inositovora NRRL Y-12698]|uniref:Uncharacterized protein n=1 Tax=Babjeviella inositovora NRRL Y-12698 TaxID=984486 RepID=A0A1E3QR93_9ASCO|nr:uncharacterized protein BABINDRAFT_129348 [Babjeviella inositovora NRRL Y-12698]ODQ80158.1 hypothetical protein BABINDRAFT_129348 [Babjeviella inositovora NRRL Y-12698]
MKFLLAEPYSRGTFLVHLVVLPPGRQGLLVRLYFSSRGSGRDARFKRSTIPGCQIPVGTTRGVAINARLRALKLNKAHGWLLMGGLAILHTVDAFTIVALEVITSSTPCLIRHLYEDRLGMILLVLSSSHQ